MWRTQWGNKAAEGKQRELFLLGVDAILSDVTENETALKSALSNLTGYTHNSSMPKLFADMDTRDKLVALACVTHAMLDNTEPPELLAWSDATLYAVYQALAIAVECEFDSDDLLQDDKHRFRYRGAVLEAYKEAHSDDPHRPDWCELPVEEIEAEDFNTMVKELADEWLWDRDFESVTEELKGLSDMDPDKAKDFKTSVDIPPEYDTQVAPGASPQRIAESLRYLLGVTKEVWT